MKVKIVVSTGVHIMYCCKYCTISLSLILYVGIRPWIRFQNFHGFHEFAKECD